VELVILILEEVLLVAILALLVAMLLVVVLEVLLVVVLEGVRRAAILEVLLVASSVHLQVAGLEDLIALLESFEKTEFDLEFAGLDLEFASIEQVIHLILGLARLETVLKYTVLDKPVHLLSG
jgi:hypothetical protein